MSEEKKPGDGIRSMRSTTAFRVVNFELYAKPVCICPYLNYETLRVTLCCANNASFVTEYSNNEYRSRMLWHYTWLHCIHETEISIVGLLCGCR